MKVWFRNRHRDYGDPNLLWPHQAVLWFKPQGKENNLDAIHLVAKFYIHLIRDLNWPIGGLKGGSLGGITSYLVWTGVEEKDSVGILFNHREYAQEAKRVWVGCRW